MQTDYETSTLPPSRRAVVGGLGLMMLGGSLSGVRAAQGQAPTKIYGVYCGKDMKSYLCELTGNAAVPVYRMLISGDLPPPSADSQQFHPSAFWGNALIIMGGELEISVSAGAMRSARALPGDTFIFIDTQGEGHAANHPGLLQAINVRFKEPWLALSKGFQGWPPNVLPPKEAAPAMNY